MNLKDLDEVNRLAAAFSEIKDARKGAEKRCANGQGDPGYTIMVEQIPGFPTLAIWIPGFAMRDLLATTQDRIEHKLNEFGVNANE